MKFTERPRRLRRSASIRDLVQETQLTSSDFVWPVFVKAGSKLREPIPSLPGCFRLSPDTCLEEVRRLVDLGLKAVEVFPGIDENLKSSKAEEALNPKGLVPQTVRLLKKAFPDLVIITDIALDPYSSDGHDGIVREGQVLNDETVIVLSEQAKMHAEAGADFVAPSDMMDGRIGWIRRQLDESGFTQTGIIAYTAKYASGFYGPFREALESAPRFGDKKTYQMNPMNAREALREAKLDQNEGADVLLVKPALAYLDVIYMIKQKTYLPMAAYNVSGEYAMVKAGASAGWLDEKTAVIEILGSIKRAGADMIFSYHTPDVLKWLAKHK
jgi:porphobilinogen synthase